MLLYELSMDVWRVGDEHRTSYYTCGGLVMSIARAAICAERLVMGIAHATICVEGW